MRLIATKNPHNWGFLVADILALLRAYPDVDAWLALTPNACIERFFGDIYFTKVFRELLALKNLLLWYRKLVMVARILSFNSLHYLNEARIL